MWISVYGLNIYRLCQTLKMRCFLEILLINLCGFLYTCLCLVSKMDKNTTYLKKLTINLVTKGYFVLFKYYNIFDVNIIVH
jgi:hypothetical protein